MGQMRSRVCPVCGRDRKGSWTCPRCKSLVEVHRRAIRSLQSWHVSYMQGDVPDVVRQDDVEFCLWDLLTLYDARHFLAEQQSLAIRLCLYENLAESQVATMMGISPRSPVSIYANVGLARLLGMAYRGEIEGFRLELPAD